MMSQAGHSPATGTDFIALGSAVPDARPSNAKDTMSGASWESLLSLFFPWRLHISISRVIT